MLRGPIVPLVCVCSVFGHISYRSDWELVKVDFRQSFPLQCTESDYESWQLTDMQVMHTHKYSTDIQSVTCVSFIWNHIYISPWSYSGREVHYGPGAEFQEKEGHIVLYQRKKLHLSSQH